jgi:hypothetical protein
MFILTIDGKEDEGAYSVKNSLGQDILYLFEEEDDAVRYAMMLEDEREYPEMRVVEIDDDLLVKACELHDYKYTIITPNDIVIPPKTDYDFI